jgi:RsiW-degrading membrane proteinase PrsW (M82 family)
MAYRAKKKNIGTKIVIWLFIVAVIASFVGTLVYYIFG